MRDRLAEALKKADADYCEIRFETDDATHVALRGAEVDRVTSGRAEGGIVRAMVRGGWGVATFDAIEDLDAYVRAACDSARLVGCETTRLGSSDVPHDVEVRAAMARDWRGVPLEEKLDLVQRYNRVLLETAPAVVTTRVSYAETFRTVHFASTRGALYTEERPRLILSMFATARRDSLVQRAHESVSSATDYGAVLDQDEAADAAARRAAALLDAPPCAGGTKTVILDPKLAGVFAHEAFGHLSEADHLHENPRMRDLMHTGREVGVKDLSIVDDGSVPALIGSARFDDEGTPTGKTYLVREGVLVGHLHSLETAGAMDAAPSGNARAIGRGHEPLVRMTNTYIEPGTDTFDGLVADVDDGVYACSMLGGQTMMEMFTFSAAYGYRIEKGKVGPLVRDVVLTGNVFETLHRIDGFADDFRRVETGGGCGKGGQSPLPVTEGSPHLRIQDVVIGGRT